MTARADLHELRKNPMEWRRRGMRSPGEIDALIALRLHGGSAEPSYADFFTN
jgi:hypothetical protein